ncbi:hypothetical protein D3C79_784600 [compost metagenome]
MVALRIMASAMTTCPLSIAKSGAIGVALLGLNTNTWLADRAIWLVPSLFATMPMPAVIFPALAFAVHMACAPFCRSEIAWLWVCTAAAVLATRGSSVATQAVPLYRYGRLLLLVSNHRSPVPIPALGAVDWRHVLFFPLATAETVLI